MTSFDLTKARFIEDIQKQGGEVYLVGGSVRDLLLKKTHKDYDLLIRYIPLPQLTKILKKSGWVNFVGKSFGILKYRPQQNPDYELDLSLPRIEKSTGLGHSDFEVLFDPNIPIEKDLARRDFTVNAMALNLANHQIIDPFDGQKDLKNKCMRQVFPNTFEEDPLRLLRCVQFAARFEMKVETETLKNMKTKAHLINTVSKERIIEEIRKLFLATKPSQGFDLMGEVGLLKCIFPSIDKMIGVLQPMKKNEDVYCHTMKVLDASKSASEMENPGNINIMFAALLHDTGKPLTVGFDESKNKTTFYGHQMVSKRIAKKWLNDYRAQTIGVNIPKVLTLIENHMFETKVFFTDRAIRRFVNKIGVETIFDLIDLRIADKKGGRFPDSMKGILNLRTKIREEINKKPPFGTGDLAINGHDIMNLGFQEGPQIGKIQKFLVESVLDEPGLNKKEVLEKMVKEKFVTSQ